MSRFRFGGKESGDRSQESGDINFAAIPFRDAQPTLAALTQRGLFSDP